MALIYGLDGLCLCRERPAVTMMSHQIICLSIDVAKLRGLVIQALWVGRASEQLRFKNKF